jgi:hypothetical protein
MKTATFDPGVTDTDGAARPDGHKKPGRRVPPVLVGLVVGLVALGVFVLVTPKGQQLRSVLALRHPVPAGSSISADDLKAVQVPASSSLSTMSVDAQASVVGRQAGHDLSPGSLLSPGDLARGATATADVGLILAPGQVPPGLTQGQQAEIVSLANPTGLSSQTATVELVQKSAANPDDLLVEVQVPAPDATALARQAATKNVVLVAR